MTVSWAVLLFPVLLRVANKRLKKSKPRFGSASAFGPPHPPSPPLRPLHRTTSRRGRARSGYFLLSSSAASPAALVCDTQKCGVDIVDTNRRGNEEGAAADYLRYFTDHFTDDEWEAIKWYHRGSVQGVSSWGWRVARWRLRGVVEGVMSRPRTYQSVSPEEYRRWRCFRTTLAWSVI